MKSWLTSPTVIPKRIVLLMESTVARQLMKTVMVNVSGLVTPANSATVVVALAVAVAIDSHAETLITEVTVLMKIVIGLVMVYAVPRVDPATEIAETLIAEVIVSTSVASGWVLRIRMVNAVSPLSALGAATSTTVAATSARMKAAHGIAALVIAVWCAETLTALTATRARGVDTVIGTVTMVVATSGLAETWTIRAEMNARTMTSALGITAIALADSVVAAAIETATAIPPEINV